VAGCRDRDCGKSRPVRSEGPSGEAGLPRIIISNSSWGSGRRGFTRQPDAFRVHPAPHKARADERGDLDVAEMVSERLSVGLVPVGPERLVRALSRISTCFGRSLVVLPE
jgi:hypothetical protein